MSIVSKAGFDQCLKFYAASFQDKLPLVIGEDKDLIIGRAQRVVLQVEEGTCISLRDIVVFGELTIASCSEMQRAHMVARDVFIGGKLSITSMEMKVRNTFIAKSTDAMQSELSDIVTTCFDMSRQMQQQMGLRSILL